LHFAYDRVKLPAEVGFAVVDFLTHDRAHAKCDFPRIRLYLAKPGVLLLWLNSDLGFVFVVKDAFRKPNLDFGLLYFLSKPAHAYKANLNTSLVDVGPQFHLKLPL
jgi:hypothetical protein